MQHPTPVLRARRPEVAFDAPLPRHWLGGNVVATHVANAANLLFPAGERFFVRSVHRFRDGLASAELQGLVKGFSGQEGSHARETERFVRALEAQGYDVGRFLALYQRIAYDLIERVTPPTLRLATTAALEHFTALLAEDTLRGGVLDDAPEAMRRLLLWHAAEEIEHRAVAFDVLRATTDSWAWRMAGLAMATACLGSFWALAAAMLVAQERGLPPSRLLRDLRAFHQRWRGHEMFGRGLLAYMRRDFHPSQADTDALARAYLDSIGLA